MGSPDQRRTLTAKLAVSAVAGTAFLVHMASERTRLDTTGLALIGLAILPWLASVLTRAELPGGLKVEFQAVKTEQRRQAQEIDAIKFLLAYFLTEHECRHLEGLAANKSYPARRNSTTSFFEAEMRRLKSLGFVVGRPGCGIRSLFGAIVEAAGKEVNVRDHFEITPRGQDYLRLRREMLTPLGGGAPEAEPGAAPDAAS
ncbi:hypothetical protein GobsT_66380 [Gemmata obscuriglobus]|uniref:Uncharacterized protein n=1 Tax=Gemmata obscuriglobus TaxID=114 RepID=A0A2Z3GN90_9BACT|nr:hypothetical protein [Gemmata obscuriglobus]AWM35679.1 hypothetical protein C1280_00670 [Gemmata obscuriglobus]QEG31794.1 hypothetical protein GobsT_66380 [Gemmata obscuriglobus]VTS11139.1 Uncharacterized protein OS=Microcoleus vaginatus FGP-2 GN=MicvaDRAFT_0847 PE=4 SV=1 [Gemmata obscuriglobus UQM 2246]